MARTRTLSVAIALVVLLGGCGGQAVVSPASGPTGPSTPAPSLGPAPSASAAPTASVAPSRSPTIAEARIADLAHLVQRLEAIHPNPFLDEGEAAFLARVAAIEAEAGALSETGFLVAIMDLMGHRDRDGHSGAWAMAQSGSLVSAWPLWLWDFPDGLRVISARAPYEDLVGARVVKVGHATLAEATAAVEPLVPRDNTSSLRSNLPIYLTLPPILEELGLLGPDDPGLTLELSDGSLHEVTPEALPIEAFRDWIFGVNGGLYPEGLPPDDLGPLHLQHRELPFWTAPIREPAAMYVGYNQVTRMSDEMTVSELATTLLDAAEAKPGQPVVVDLRNNGGGDNNTFRPLRDALETIAEAQPGSVRLITGRSTFSAAGNFVTDLKVGRQGSGIRLVGEAPGGGLNIYGDVDVVTLPASGIVVLISGRYHERAPGDDRLEIAPDVPAEVTWADYAAGRDPVLDAALEP